MNYIWWPSVWPMRRYMVGWCWCGGCGGGRTIQLWESHIKERLCREIGPYISKLPRLLIFVLKPTSKSEMRLRRIAASCGICIFMLCVCVYFLQFFFVSEGVEWLRIAVRTRRIVLCVIRVNHITEMCRNVLLQAIRACFQTSMVMMALTDVVKGRFTLWVHCATTI